MPHTDRTLEPEPRENKTLTLVREVGFDQIYDGCSGKVTERIFFLGPHLLAGREEGAHATEEAVQEFIRYWENQIEVAKDYLLNGREARTHLWTKSVRQDTSV